MLAVHIERCIRFFSRSAVYGCACLISNVWQRDEVCWTYLCIYAVAYIHIVWRNRTRNSYRFSETLVSYTVLLFTEESNIWIKVDGVIFSWYVRSTDTCFGRHLYRSNLNGLNMLSNYLLLTYCVCFYRFDDKIANHSNMKGYRYHVSK